METHHHQHKKEFQVERLILFSDAVFAIAITLLIIEVKVPELHGTEVTEAGFWHAMSELLPKISGFIVSFFLIGLYWTIHHRMFGYVVNYTQALLWLNLGFLFSIVLMPFSTAVYSEYSTPERINLVSPFAVYVFNICLTSIMNYFLWRYVSNPAHKVAEHLPPKHIINEGKKRSLIIAGVFILSLLVTIWLPGIGRMLLMLIPFAMKLAKGKPVKK